MKTSMLILAFGLAAGAAHAAEPVATPKPAANSAPSSAAKPSAAPAPRADAAPVDPAQARAQLDDMRRQMRDLSRKMADLSRELGDEGPNAYAIRYLGDRDRAMLGVVMWPDEDGVRIGGLTPGGPAEKAGVRNGDLIVAIDGKALAKDSAGPGRGVGDATRALADLKIDQTVRLGLLRDGKKLDIAVKAERREAWNWPRMFLQDSELPGGERDVRIIRNPQLRREVAEARREADEARREGHRIERHVDVERMQRDVLRRTRMHMRMPWWGLNLASLGPDLGSYFGTTKGALVLSAEPEGFPELKAGDVLLEIDGAAVDSPEQAMRALRDAREGSDVKLKVMRQKKPQLLSMKAPEFKSMFPPPPPEAPEPPEPPEAPAPPEVPEPPEPPKLPVAPAVAAMAIGIPA